MVNWILISMTICRPRKIFFPFFYWFCPFSFNQYRCPPPFSLNPTLVDSLDTWALRPCSRCHPQCRQALPPSWDYGVSPGGCLAQAQVLLSHCYPGRTLGEGREQGRGTRRNKATVCQRINCMICFGGSDPIPILSFIYCSFISVIML